MSPSSPTHDRYSAARALRALRPLRTIRMLPKLKQQVNTIMTSLPLLLDVMLLAVFVLHGRAIERRHAHTPQPQLRRLERLRSSA